jgi:hypothetical protein
MKKKDVELLLWALVVFIVVAVGWVILNKNFPRQELYYQSAREKEIETLIGQYEQLNEQLQIQKSTLNQTQDEQERAGIELSIDQLEWEIRNVENQIMQLQQWELSVLSDGKVMHTESIFINADRQLTASLYYLPEISLGNSSAIDLTISSFETLDPQLNSPNHFINMDESLWLIRVGDKEKIKLMMQAKLIGVGFDIVGTESIQEVNSDNITKWSWLVRPKAEGQQDLFINITIPIVEDGQIKRVVTNFSLRPVHIDVQKSYATLFREILPNIITGFLGLVGVIIGIIVNRKRNEEE